MRLADSAAGLRLRFCAGADAHRRRPRPDERPDTRTADALAPTSAPTPSPRRGGAVSSRDSICAFICVANSHRRGNDGFLSRSLRNAPAVAAFRFAHYGCARRRRATAPSPARRPASRATAPRRAGVKVRLPCRSTAVHAREGPPPARIFARLRVCGRRDRLDAGEKGSRAGKRGGSNYLHN